MRKQTARTQKPKPRLHLLAAPLLLLLAAAAPTYTPAPMPQAQPDQSTNDSSDGTRIRPNLFSTLDTGSFRGDGYTPGSTFDATEEAHWLRPTPGVSILVPLQ